MPTFAEALIRAADCLDVSLDDKQTQTMLAHFERLVETNRKFNLTRITEPEDAAVKLYADSLAPLVWLRHGGATVSRVLDVGTGAGIPAVPLAVARPAWQVTALDSTGKKVRFVQQCAAEIPIENVEAVHARAGQWKPSRRFDLVLFKAVGTLTRCLAACRGLLVRGGHVICFKGPNVSPAEIDAAEEEAERNGLRIWDTFDYDLPCANETLEHSLFIYRRD